MTEELIVTKPEDRDRSSEPTTLWYLSGTIKSEGNLFFETTTIPDIPEYPEDKYHIVKTNEVGRLDIIAYKYYQKPELWWVIAVANEIFFPLDEVTAGIVLRIPDETQLFAQVIK